MNATDAALSLALLSLVLLLVVHFRLGRLPAALLAIVRRERAHDFSGALELIHSRALSRST